jgi:hypothetical protein
MRITKKDKLERFDTLQEEKNLLDLYLHDTQNGIEPDETEIEFNVRGQLFRSRSPHCGYVVIYHIPDLGQHGSTEIKYLDDWNRLSAERFSMSEHTLPLRIVLERLTIARNRLAEVRT